MSSSAYAGQVEFTDNGIVSDKIDPLFDPTTAFPYDEVERHLGTDEPDRAEINEKLAQALHAIFVWLLDCKARDRERMLGRRLLAFCWTVDPGLLGGISAAQLARDLGLTGAAIQSLTGEVSRVFQVRNRAQAHARGNWKGGAK